MFLEREDDGHATFDDESQAPLSLAHSDGHCGPVVVPLERGNDNYATDDHPAPMSLPPSAVHPNGSAVGMQFRSHNLDTDTIGSNGQPAVLSASHDWPLKLLGHSDSVPDSADSGRSI